MEPRLFVATTVIAYRPAEAARGRIVQPGRLADALMRSPDVVAVRVNDDATAVYRVDVPATSGTEAEAQATRPAFVAGGALGLDIEVVDVTAVADEERIAAFRRWASSG